MKSSRGFTIIELVIVIAFFAAASIIFFVQKSNIEATARDTARKTSINAIYYGLEEVYFKDNGFYPRTLSSDALPSVDPAHFKDPKGIAIGESASDFRYEVQKCNGDKCQGYTLRTTLEHEDDYIKTNRSE